MEVVADFAGRVRAFEFLCGSTGHKLNLGGYNRCNVAASSRALVLPKLLYQPKIGVNQLQNGKYEIVRGEWVITESELCPSHARCPVAVLCAAPEGKIQKKRQRVIRRRMLSSNRK